MRRRLVRRAPYGPTRAGSVYDVAVIGGGIIGLATARSILQRRSSTRVVVLEKESALGTHQTGHNSGVIHSGVYYLPESLKAKLCVEGAHRLTSFCDDRGIPYKRPGKLILASSEAQVPALDELQRRGTMNGVRSIRRVSRAEIADLEPNAVGAAGLYVADTAIVDFSVVARAYASSVVELGGEIRTDAEVTSGRETDTVHIETPTEGFGARIVVNCAGLHSDVVARRLGWDPSVAIVPFRGEYFFLRPGLSGVVRGLVYPVPDPRFPFLGVHLTPRLDGRIEAGPNAVLAWAREGYKRFHLSPRELGSTLRYPGFRSLSRKYWRMGLEEYKRSFSKRVFANALSELVPAIKGDDLIRGGSGVRAQAVAPNGDLVDDFWIERSRSTIHVLNAPSPAATASLAIGEHIAAIAVVALAGS